MADCIYTNIIPPKVSLPQKQLLMEKVKAVEARERDCPQSTCHVNTLRRELGNVLPRYFIRQPKLPSKLGSCQTRVHGYQNTAGQPGNPVTRQANMMACLHSRYLNLSHGIIVRVLISLMRT